MRILCVTSTYWPAFQYGGLITAVHCLNKALVKKGVDVSVYTTNAGLDNQTPVNCEIDIDGVKVTYFVVTKLWEFLGTIGWQFSLEINKALRNNLPAFDLVYIINVWSYPAAVAASYCRLHRKPYILVPSGMLYPKTFWKKAWKKIPYYHLVVKRNLKGAALIHYTTEDEAEKTHSFLGLTNRAVVLPNGIALSEFSNLPQKESMENRYPWLKHKKVLLFLGRLHWIKGLDILVKAYAKLVKDRKDLHLLIVGGGKDRYISKVKGWIRKQGLDNSQVTFCGMLLARQKLEAYAGSDIFVLPSYSENFGMTVIEAMACGVPVVISNRVGIYKEIERNKAGLVVDADAESLYLALLKLLENPELKKELVINARRLLEGYYDVDKVADKMIEVYSRIIDRR